MIEITVELIGYNSRGPIFDAFNGTTLLASLTTQPLLDSCRFLKSTYGIDPETEITMRYSGSESAALKTTVGYAANLTVSETKAGSLRFTPWVPFNMPRAVVAGSEIPAQNDLEAAE